MRTVVRHTRLGCYDIMSPTKKSETYTFFFDTNDKENKTVTFDYGEENAPQLNVHDFRVDELIEELEGCISKRYLFSSSYNHVGQKSHEERIYIAKMLAEENLLDDLQAYRERLFTRKDRLDKQIDRINLEIERLDREVYDLKAEENK